MPLGKTIINNPLWYCLQLWIWYLRLAQQLGGVLWGTPQNLQLFGTPLQGEQALTNFEQEAPWALSGLITFGGIALSKKYLLFWYLGVLLSKSHAENLVLWKDSQHVLNNYGTFNSKLEMRNYLWIKTAILYSRCSLWCSNLIVSNR